MTWIWNNYDIIERRVVYRTGTIADGIFIKLLTKKMVTTTKSKLSSSARRHQY